MAPGEASVFPLVTCPGAPGFDPRGPPSQAPDLEGWIVPDDVDVRWEGTEIAAPIPTSPSFCHPKFHGDR